MSTKTLNMSEDLLAYLMANGVRENEILQALRQETLSQPAFQASAHMQIAPEQGQLMGMLVQLCGVRRALEIGTYTGYSSICIAGAMPPEGRLLCCDVNEEWGGVAQRYWSLAQLTKKIDLRIAPAIETLQGLLEVGEANSFDFVFIDADKTSYDAYYEASLELLRPGGLIAIDNVLWHGKVIDPLENDEDTVAIRQLNSKLQADQRIDYVMVPVADGLSLCRKRQPANI